MEGDITVPMPELFYKKLISNRSLPVASLHPVKYIPFWTLHKPCEEQLRLPLLAFCLYIFHFSGLPQNKSIVFSTLVSFIFSKSILIISSYEYWYFSLSCSSELSPTPLKGTNTSSSPRKSCITTTFSLWYLPKNVSCV